MNKKIKVVWLTCINASSVNQSLPFNDQKEKNSFVPWLTLLTDEFKNHLDKIELHILSVFNSMDHDADFCKDGIYYHFISQRFRPFRRAVPHILRYYSKYYNLKRKVKNIVDIIKPDIVHIFGAEHDIASAFFILEYPKIVTVNWYVYMMYQFNQTPYYKRMMKMEKRIYQQARFVNIKANFMKEIAYKFNPTVKLYWYNYIMQMPEVHESQFPEKDADIVFGARIMKNKGIEDLIEAVGILKPSFPQIRVKVIGPGEPSYLEYLIQKIKSMGLDINVSIIGFIKDKTQMYIEIAKSRIYVLPTYFDIIPYSLLEAMIIGTASVSYSVAGIPDLNTDNQSLLLVQPGDVINLSNNIARLLLDASLRERLSINGRNTVLDRFNNSVIFKQMMEAYHDVIKKY